MEEETRYQRVFDWMMDEVVLRLMMLNPKWYRARKEHMDGVRAQDMRLDGQIHPENQPKWLKP